MAGDATMSQQDPPPHYPRDKDQLLRELDLADRLKDLQDEAIVRERLAPRWWEAIIAVIQFAAALGLLASLVQHPLTQEDPYGRLIVFWLGLMILALVFGFELVVLRLHYLRRVNQMLLRRLYGLDKRLERLESGQRETTKPVSHH